jgi:adenosylcobinamide-phosphate synthase
LKFLPFPLTTFSLHLQEHLNFSRVALVLNGLVLLLAAILDYAIGDPWGWPHPVQGMGWGISRYTQFALKRCSSPLARRWAGMLLGSGAIAGSGLTGWLIVRGAIWIHPLLGMAAESILLASCFAGRSLRAAADDVLAPLTAGDLEQARSRLSQYVGRDTAGLSESEIYRAILETIAENTTDGVTAPLFYGIIGAFLPGVGSVPLALAYKAASTLDSTVGYRQEPYTHFGWFSARGEDYLTWLPCRLTVVTLALLSRKPQAVWRICRRDGTKDPSPNSGWSEAAFAAALDVRLGGTNSYGGVIKHKPLLGNPTSPITREKINRALGLMRACFLIGLGFALMGLLAAQIAAESILSPMA